jgi:hypothetical protein
LAGYARHWALLPLPTTDAGQHTPDVANSSTGRSYVTGSLATLLHRLITRLRHVLADVRELEERRSLLDRPWEEDLLHWARGDQGWQLHGQFVPPARRRTSSVTSRGWCPRMSRINEPGHR